MSRCFPYSAPGHLSQGLVESLKLERERVLPKSEQKLHKKREGEKVKKNKDKKGKNKTQCLSKKFKKLDDVQCGYKDEVQLEKSNITEEHEPPAGYISEGSQNSLKRKRETVPHSECRVDGKKIKIRFTLKTPHGSDATISKESACSSGVSADSNQNSRSSVASAPQRELWHNVGLKEHSPPSEPSCSVASVPQQKLWHDVEKKEKHPSSSRTSARDNKIFRAALQYETLIENWLPPMLEPELNDDDSGDDWLLPKRQLGKPAAKRLDDNDVHCHSSSTSCPRAHYLPDAEMYALPFTVPF
ncbi:Glutathione S-transferase family protein isoform 1 [Hibiscus syriacus]|uniref:Glutathione S-transferase family protein isoform 1 n=1 Tax=Hibiscus syriacus TaxID=106335 RepID=A0A6A2ZF78_HIBSY|nr:Glutathione S-transferase family protein isoform 1 [Hibiscus syriacus]